MTSTSLNTDTQQRRRGFSVVLAIELWERFGFYGMQAVLTIFMVEQLGMSDHRINMLLGASSALAYIMPVLGGFLGDRVLGARSAMLLGALGLMSGYICLAAFPQSLASLLMALALIAVGNGLFKPNAGNLVRGIYSGDDAALDTVFTLYYMTVNLGSTVSILLTPWLQTTFGPRVAFSTCACGLAMGLFYYLLKAQWLRAVISNRSPMRMSIPLLAGLCVALIAAIALCEVILRDEWIAQQGIILAGIGLIFIWVFLYLKSNTLEKYGLLAGYSLSLLGAFYYIYYQQSITSLTLYTLRNVSGDFTVSGHTLFHLTPGQFQALNSLWILILSPILASAYQVLNRRKREPSIGVKMLIGYIALSAAFFIWWLSSTTTNAAVSPWAMVAGYGFMSLSELLTGGLGLAVVARYVPARFGGVVNGSVYALWGVAMYIGSITANLAESSAGQTVGAELYTPLFRGLCLSSVAIVIIGLALRWVGLLFSRKMLTP